MMRAHAGLVTTLVAGDEHGRYEQLKSIVREHAEDSGGDIGAFAGRMGKQVEAGALVTYSVLRLLAKRLGLSEGEAHAVIAQAIAGLDDEAFPT